MNKYKIFAALFLVFYFQIVFPTILLNQRFMLGALERYNCSTEKTIEDSVNKYLTSHINDDELFSNIVDSIEISNVFNSYSPHGDAVGFAFEYDKNNILKPYFKEIGFDNSLYLIRILYQDAYYACDKDSLEKTIERINNSTGFERICLILRIRPMYTANSSVEQKNKITESLMSLWERTEYPQDYFFIAISYPPIKSETKGIFDGKENKHHISISEYMNHQVPVAYFYFLYKFFTTSNDVINPNFTQDKFIEENITVKPFFNNKQNGIDFEKKYQAAYEDLIKTKQILDADFTFFWFRNVYNSLAIDLARKHIQNPDFKDARYKTVYYLVNHDFDYSFPILTNMVNNNSLHINEKKNFYRGLARLNKLPYSVLTKEQQQKANDYLKQQMHSEQDIAIKLYIDFLLSICVNEYGLSDDRTAFLNSLKETASISPNDIAQIDRRLKIIKYSIYMHSPSIFDSYVNGLKTKKPFVDVTKVDIYNLPVYEAKANGETWYYHDVNSEAYIAYTTNKYISSNLTIPSTLDNYPVVGIIDGAFVDFQGSITNIIIPNSVRTIATHAFAHNTNLCSIAIPNSVTKIGQDVFKKSINLKKIYLEEGSSLTDECFYDSYHVNLHPNCKIIRTKFENGLPVIPQDEKNDE